MVPREIGATQGSRSSRRTSHLPGNSLWRRSARTLPRTITRSWETTAKTNVFWTAVRNLVVSITLR
jgi:hypothetical protein